ncbi:MAG: GvpL/GvpF family gas vesicle protein [Gaiellaceae bacterium]
MIRVYAFVAQLERLPEVAGVDGRPLEEHALEDVSAVVSRHSAPAAGDPRADAVSHGLVVEGLAALAPAVLPVRFGQTFGDAAALAAVMRERRDAIRRALDHVRGCVEIGVRVAGAALPRSALAASSGSDYMQERLARLAEHDAITHELHERLEDLSRASVQGSRAGFEAAYLLERTRLDAAQDAVRRFATSHPELTVVSTGPWAPYSFGGVAS